MIFTPRLLSCSSFWLFPSSFQVRILSGNPGPDAVNAAQGSGAGRIRNAYKSVKKCIVARRTIDQLLNEGQRFTPLQKLLHQASNRDAWTQELRAVLPEPLARHFSVAAMRGTALVVLCDNAASATRLRFLAPDVVSKLQSLSHFQHIETLKLQVAEN